MELRPVDRVHVIRAAAEPGAPLTSGECFRRPAMKFIIALLSTVLVIGGLVLTTLFAITLG